jgi:hypothetical protein
MMVFQNGNYPRGISWCKSFYADLLYREWETIGARAEYIRIFAAACNNDVDLAYHCLARLADPDGLVHAATESVW